MEEADVFHNSSAMASKNSDSNEGKQFIQGIMDGSSNLPVSYPGFKLLKPSFDEVDQQCSLDILPLLFEEDSCPARLKYPMDSSSAKDVYSISVLPQDGNNLQCASQLAFLSFLEVPNPAKDQMSKDGHLNCQNCIDLQINSVDAYSPCVVDINIAKDSLQTPEFDKEAVESLNSESILTNMQRVLRRQSSLKVGVKLLQLLLNHCTSRDKTLAERVHETPNNRWRRYKRAASIDSRKILLLFSILSSLGTLILIYLTLRVRQSVDS